MVTRRPWRIAAVLIGGLVAVACGSPSQDSQSSQSEQTECAAGDPICSGQGDYDSEDDAATDAGAATAYCSPAEATCAAGSDCCSGICNGTCMSGSTDPDSGVDAGLTPPPTPTPVPVPMCKGSGDDCNIDSDCCSGECWFSTCILG